MSASQTTPAPHQEFLVVSDVDSHAQCRLRVAIENGRLAEVHGDPSDPQSKRELPARERHLIEFIYAIAAPPGGAGAARSTPQREANDSTPELMQAGARGEAAPSRQRHCARLAVGLSAAKLWGWAATGGVALLISAADAVVDILAATVTFLGVRFAQRAYSPEHRYGHGKGLRALPGQAAKTGLRGPQGRNRAAYQTAAVRGLQTRMAKLAAGERARKGSG